MKQSNRAKHQRWRWAFTSKRTPKPNPITKQHPQKHFVGQLKCIGPLYNYKNNKETEAAPSNRKKHKTSQRNEKNPPKTGKSIYLQTYHVTLSLTGANYEGINRQNSAT